MENTQLVKDCQVALVGSVIKRNSLSFDEIFNLKYPSEVKEDPKWMFFWYKFTIFAKTKKDFPMSVWNGHNVDPEFSTHICPKGTKVIVWMVSRMGDIGITDNLKNSVGYDCRGIDVEELYDWEIVKICI